MGVGEEGPRLTWDQDIVRLRVASPAPLYTPIAEFRQMRLAKDQGLCVGSSPTRGTSLSRRGGMADAASLSLVQLWVQLPLPGPSRSGHHGENLKFSPIFYII